MKNSEEKKIIRITIDNKLDFKSHVKNSRKKSSEKIWALARISSYQNDAQKSFSYCRMFTSKQTNNINCVLNDETSNFETLLAERSHICNHDRNIQILMTEACGM